MGLLINGRWHDQWYNTEKNNGKFVRSQSQFRNWITPTGEAGPTGQSGFRAEKDRYHLYVSLACPWAHRTLIFRRLKKLEEYITVSIVSPNMLEQGWALDGEYGSNVDEINAKQFLHEIYTLAQPDYTGRVTVPVLWDKKTHTIVNNESAEIIRMFNSAFNTLTGNQDDYYPENLRTTIDDLNTLIYSTVNNGVYRAGFATRQHAYEEAYDELFQTLDQLESRLSTHRYLAGDVITEADWRLFTTLIRFDAVYYAHFKCNLQRIEDYPNLSHYLRELYQVPGIKETVNFKHIKQHYFYSHETINPSRIVPKGPHLDFERAHNRHHIKAQLREVS